MFLNAAMEFDHIFNAMYSSLKTTQEYHLLHGFGLD